MIIRLKHSFLQHVDSVLRPVGLFSFPRGSALYDHKDSPLDN